MRHLGFFGRKPRLLSLHDSVDRRANHPVSHVLVFPLPALRLPSNTAQVTLVCVVVIVRLEELGWQNIRNLDFAWLTERTIRNRVCLRDYWAAGIIPRCCPVTMGLARPLFGLRRGLRFDVG